MKRLAFITATTIIAAAVLSLPSAQAGQWAYPVHVERQRSSTLVIEHTPVGAVVGVVKIGRGRAVVRKHRVRRTPVTATRRQARRKKTVIVRRSLRPNSAIAGGCYGGGFVARRDPAGAVLTLHRDVCEGIAPVSSHPVSLRP